MKLLRVLVLIALPLYCFAGSGCSSLEEVINKTIDSQVSVEEYQNLLKSYSSGPATDEAIAQLKQCFLSQSDEILTKVGTLLNIIYESKWCALF
ncbi:mammaglobin-A-like [Mirounga angustirostris]|uniref:mammaglobin-A-like n=1 Tax=Mirounga angustirostris TaxID=9716 RepID=UPI00156BEC30|nr:mammaglobin-A isoform X1 [Mirounga leonina]XP_045748519.1 mammaglobin-A-like [Mirounga angustirostris]